MQQTLKRHRLSLRSCCLTLVILLSVVQQFHCVNVDESEQRVRLTELQTITLYKDKYTTSRRLPPILQLRCIGSFWKCQTYAPNVVECYNKGFNGIDVQWECKADLDKMVKFGMMKVICEGYSFPDDPFILRNSCGLEYSLELSRNSRNFDYYNSNMYETSKLSNFLTLLIMVVIILAVYKTCNKNRELELRRELNGTYAHVIDDIYPTSSLGPHTGGLTVAAAMGGATSSYSSAAAPSVSGGLLFPPPPPPYGSLVPAAQTAEPAATTTQSTGRVVSSPETLPLAQSAVTTTTAVPDTQPTEAAAAAAAAARQDDVDKPVDAAVAATATNTAGSSWRSSFLAGTAAVSGYLLSRRNTSPRRSDSPPPSYEETRNFQSNAATR